MTKSEAAFWDKYIPRLITVGVATDLDAPALEQMAFWFGVWQETREALKGADYSTIGASRLLTANQKAFDSFRRLAVHFGLTPLARNSLDVSEPVEDDGGFFK